MRDNKVTVLVTGSKGFIGRHLVPYLKERDYGVVEVDRVDGREVVDLVKEDLEGVDYVVHLAAQTSVWNEDLRQIEQDNICAFLHIYQLCRETGVRFIYTSSSCSVNTTSMYGLSKWFDDQLVALYGGDCVGLRLHNVYGKDPRPDTLLGVCMKETVVTLWNEGDNVRHFTYVGDVCKCVEKAFSLPAGLYNVMCPATYTTEEFAWEVSYYKTLYIKYTRSLRPRDKRSQSVDTSLKNLLNKKYTTLQEGIKKVFD